MGRNGTSYWCDQAMTTFVTFRSIDWLYKEDSGSVFDVSESVCESASQVQPPHSQVIHLRRKLELSSLVQT